MPMLVLGEFATKGMAAMSSLTISNTLANAALSPLEPYSRALLKRLDEASTGHSINSAADAPSGLAIYNSLTAQANGFAAAAQNVSTANDAVSVADGALQQTQTGLQSLSALAVQANNDFLSNADRADLQTVANQLVRQINTNAQNATFNGQPLLQGTSAGQAAGVQSGASEGATTALNLPNGTAVANFIQNIDLSSSAGATAAQGQIDEAIPAIANARAELGAQSQALTAQGNNNDITAANLTASASSIGDANQAQVSTELALLRTKQQISLATLQNANTTLGYLNRFFNIPA
jgi:flagellin